ncbi:putative reverse transcriptase domain-containing protein, partial [Tanacetum coccineum]
AYKLKLPEELSNVHSTFQVSNLKKCLSDESLVIPMKELWLDDKLNFVEEPVEIMDREVKQLKQSRIPIVKERQQKLVEEQRNLVQQQSQAKAQILRYEDELARKRMPDQAEVVVAQEELQEKIDLVEKEEELIEEEEFIEEKEQ